MFTGNRHRQSLFRNLSQCIENEIRPRFSYPLLINGSFVTAEEKPNDVDVALDLRHASIDDQVRGLKFKNFNGKRLLVDFGVDSLINLPGRQAFSLFFQGMRAKTAKFLGLDPSHRKGILSIG